MELIMIQANYLSAEGEVTVKVMFPLLLSLFLMNALPAD